MNIVVLDCSIVVPWFFPEENSRLSLSLLRAVESGTVGCIAPDILLVEFANVAWKKFRQGFCSAQDAQVQTGLLMRMPMEIVESSSMLPAALDLACSHAHPVYDCIYLSIAKAGGIALATLDQHLAQAAGDTGVAVWR